MLSYCLKSRKNTESKDPNAVKTKSGRIILSSNCVVYCNRKKSRLIKKQDVSRLLSSLGIEIPILSKLPMACDILF